MTRGARNRRPEESPSAGCRRRTTFRSTVDAGRAAPDHRAERRRQDHALQPDHRRPQRDAGTIRLFGEEVQRLQPHQRAHRGLARTYQIITLFPHDTLEHNVALSLLGLSRARWNMFAPLAATRASLRRGAARARAGRPRASGAAAAERRCPTAKSGASRSRWRSRRSRSCCCSTSRSRACRARSASRSSR